MGFDLERFIDAQNAVWDTVVAELKNEQKESHWMWFVFPQIKGISKSLEGEKYSISTLEEATAYYDNDILRERLIEVIQILLEAERPLFDMFGDPDYYKFISCITLFRQATDDPLFESVLDFYCLEEDDLTLNLID
tara:strand:+ start:21672 stop:22079 length:408 start_codon:yes stop_codon:yes gene_type:complete